MEIDYEDLVDACVGDLSDSISHVFGVVPISIVYNGHRLLPEDDHRKLSTLGPVHQNPKVEVELTPEQVR